MFTGIVEVIGKVLRIERGQERADLVIEAGVAAQGAKPGDSIAVNGACLTVTGLEGECLTFHAVAETLQCTNLGELSPGSPVNLERAVRADQRLDGHVVQGHVDGMGRVREMRWLGESSEIVIEPPAGLERYLVEKGSVSVDGISLTVWGIQGGAFSVALIPYTLQVTNLRDAKAGSLVNLEADVIAKYVERLLAARGL